MSCAHWGWFNAFQIATQPGLKGHVFVGLQKERIEKQLTELAVADPRFAGPQPLERGNIDKDRPAAGPLDVEGRRVFECHVGTQRGVLEFEGQQRGVLQHAERPLVGIGNKGNRLML